MAPDTHKGAIAPPVPGLTPEEMLRRATALRPLLRARQAECEKLGRVAPDVQDELVRGGFYRIVQPRRYGGYEFDVPTFFRVMMEMSRGCSETGWVLALTSGHTMILAGFPDEGQAAAYGTSGDFRAPATFAPPGTAVDTGKGSYRISGTWASASGCDYGTHFIGAALVQKKSADEPDRVLHFVVERKQYRIIDDWHVMGMQGTGSKSVSVENAEVPAYCTLEASAFGRGAEPALRTPSRHPNPMYGAGRIPVFLIGEASAVSVGTARGALDLYEEVLRTKKGYYPPYVEHYKNPEFQRYYGEALALIATAEAALLRLGQDYMDYAAEEAAGGAPFDDEKANRLTLIEQQCIRLAWDAVELISRTAGTNSSVKQGQPIGRALRNLAAINTHPALQLDRTAPVAARTRFGLQQSYVAKPKN